MSYSSIEQRHGFFGKVGNVFHIFKDYIATNTSIIIKNIVIILFVFLIVFIAVSAVVFWLIRKGPPEVTVPKVTEKELIDSLLILQKKNLNVLIDPRYFSEHQKNIVVDQIPKAGSIVREGKDIKLIVSKGPIISIVEDYTGKTMAYVQNRLQEIFFSGQDDKNREHNLCNF
jgi:beta-lactam-binding protein with PASTA domain